ncbi:hypothetical protein EYV94_27975 [Puteibacter caeruleilacunae]|nr:hypothetical protein EYV94_27975 [Puteibacter caeruleilacunae]
MERKILIESARKNWLIASKKLNFKIVTPYEVKTSEWTKTVFAFLPEYGSKNGALVCLMHRPLYELDDELYKWARDNGIFCSFIPDGAFQSYDEDEFLEVLEDWHKFE